MNYSASLEALLEQAAASVLEVVAKEGLVLLRSILAKSGFLESEFLKNYELSSYIEDGAVVFEITIDEAAVSDSSIQEVQQVSQPIDDTDESEKYTIPTIPSRAFAAAKRLVNGGSRGGSYDARTSYKTSHDARKPARDARTDVRTTASDRAIRRDAAAPAPRKMRVDRQGKLVISFRKQMEENDGTYQYPSGDFSGIMNEFLEKLQVLLFEQFSPQLEEIITRNFS